MLPIEKVKGLAWDFIHATTFIIGTDENRACEILQQVCRDKRAFETEVASQLGSLGFDYYTDDGGNIIDTILRAEMEGSELLRAQDCYEDGYETYRASAAEYLYEGLVSNLDIHNPQALLSLTIGLVAFTGLSAISAPVAAIVGGVACGGTFLFGCSAGIKNIFEIVTGESEIGRKQNFRELGSAVGMAALSAPFAYKSFPKALDGWLALKNQFAARKAMTTAITTVPRTLPVEVLPPEISPPPTMAFLFIDAEVLEALLAEAARKGARSGTITISTVRNPMGLPPGLPPGFTPRHALPPPPIDPDMEHMERAFARIMQGLVGGFMTTLWEKRRELN